MKYKRRDFLKTAGIAIGSIMSSSLLQAESAAMNERPNIIFIFSDDHATSAISSYGSKLIQTPNIDRLAKEGVLFENVFCGNSICGPSRATILTGLHSHAHGYRANAGPYHSSFNGDQQTFPKLMQKSGYQTALFGKWHLGDDPQGFNSWKVLPGQGQYYNPDFRTENGNIRINGHSTDIVTDLSLEWLDNCSNDKPFLLMCQYKAPHRNWLPSPEDYKKVARRTFPEPPNLLSGPKDLGEAEQITKMSIARHMAMVGDLQGPNNAQKEPAKVSHRYGPARMTPDQLSEFQKLYEKDNQKFIDNPPKGDDLVRWKYQRYMRNYLACVTGIDRNIGRLLKWLDKHPEQANNTIVVYSSDQGFFLGENGWYDKRWIFEESLKMPLIMRWPDHWKAGMKVSALVQNIDFAPTFLDLAQTKEEKPMHGKSLAGLITGEIEDDKFRDAIYYRYYEGLGQAHNVVNHYGIRTDRYKLVHIKQDQFDYWELFDLQNDSDEQKDLYNNPEYEDIKKMLHIKLKQLQEQYGDST